MVVEILLHLFHLFARRLFSIFLHARVNGGVDFQPTRIQIVAVVLTPILEIVSHGLAEIFCLPVIVLFDLEIKLDGNILQRVAHLTRDVAMMVKVV